MIMVWGFVDGQSDSDRVTDKSLYTLTFRGSLIVTIWLFWANQAILNISQLTSVTGISQTAKHNKWGSHLDLSEVVLQLSVKELKIGEKWNFKVWPEDWGQWILNKNDV